MLCLASSVQYFNITLCKGFTFTPPSTTSSQRWTQSLGICPAISFLHIQSPEHVTSASHQPKVAVALRISSLIGTYCHPQCLLCKRLNVGLPILHKSRQGSTLWKWLRKILEALRPLVAAPPIPLLPVAMTTRVTCKLKLHVLLPWECAPQNGTRIQIVWC